MTITKKYLRDWENSHCTYITDKQKEIILERFGEEPWPYEWSEQDIHVQIRNYLYCGHWEKPMKQCETDELLLSDDLPF